MLSCTKTRELLPLWVGGDLPAQDQAALREHLAGCPACRAAADAWRGDHARLVAVLGEDLPPSLEPGFLEHAIDTALAGTPHRSRQSRLSLWQFALPVAAVLALFFIWRGINPTRPPLDNLVESRAGVITWAELQTVFQGCLTDPVSPDSWQAAETGGVIAVLSPAPSGRGYLVADCIEAGNLARIQNFPWLEQRLRRYRYAGGQERQIVLAVCSSAELDRATRRGLQKGVLKLAAAAG